MKVENVVTFDVTTYFPGTYLREIENSAQRAFELLSQKKTLSGYDLNKEQGE